MRSRSDLRRLLTGLAVGLLPGLMTSCLNPDVVNQATGGLYPAAPGDEPFLLVRIINDTQADLARVPVVYDDGTGAKTINLKVQQGERGIGVLLDWPVTRVTVGSLDSTLIPSVTATLEEGVDVVIPTLINPARADTDYVRGDALVYRFTSDSRNPAAINLSLYKIDGSTERGPFTRADTFRTVRQILEVSALGGATTAKTLTPLTAAK